MMFHSASTIDWYCSGLSSLISAFSRSLFSSSSMFSSRILGFVNDLGCCSKPAYENVFLNATPSTRNESRSPPPCTFLMPIILSSSSTGSRIDTASTTIWEKNSFSPLTSFELSVVLAHLRNRSFFSASLRPSKLIDSSLILASASSQAMRYALMMLRGCTPSSTNGFASFKNSPERITTDVVPSPTSASWASDTSTRLLAAG
mmetsp:Transcript_11873/g.35043  ORF Transcript_11873/g.35043 Transcript_11873/m.35043 type:complete len:203 (-) Transcript_11873:356-964(-)